MCMSPAELRDVANGSLLPPDPLGDDAELVKCCTTTLPHKWGQMESVLTGYISNFPVPFTYMLVSLLLLVLMPHKTINSIQSMAHDLFL